MLIKILQKDVEQSLYELKAEKERQFWIWPERRLAFRFWNVSTYELEEILASKAAYPDFLVLHCWADVWHSKKMVVLGRIKSLLGFNEKISARQTRFVRKDAPCLHEFMKCHHIHPNPKVRHNFGLFLHETPVAMASFSRAKKLIKVGQQVKSFEMVRFANSTGTNVVGGLSKLISGFAKSYQPDDLVSYVDADWSDGRGYRAVGFNLIEVKAPQFFWLDPQSLVRYFPSDAIDKKGLHKIWNTGSYKFELKFENMKTPRLQ